MSFLKSLLYRCLTAGARHETLTPARSARAAFEPAPKYPPADPGLPACDVASIVASQSDLIERLRRTASCSAADFDARYLTPIRNLARYVHLLPASAHDHFSGPGGLFRLCLEIAFYSAQAADGRIFTPSADVETRHSLEPLYKYGAFLAGLVCELYRPLAAAIVTDEKGVAWPKFLLPLDDWIAQRSAPRYYVSWQASERMAVPGGEAASVIGGIWPHEQLSRLDQGSPAIVRDAFAVSLGQGRDGDSILGDLVRSIRLKVLQQDELTRRSRYGRLRCGHHLEVHLVDALRERVSTGAWKVHNGMEGPVWFGTDGLYLAWPECCQAVTQDLDGRGVRGLPRNPLTLAEVLGIGGFLVAQDSGQWVWSIVTSAPDAAGDPVRRKALRLRDPATLIGFLQAKPKDRPFAEYLVERTPAAQVAAVPSQDLQAVAASYELVETAPAAQPPASVPAAAGPAGGQEDAASAAAPPKQAAPLRRPAAAQAMPAVAAVTPAAAPGAAGGAAQPPERAAPVSSPARLVSDAVRAALKEADAEMLGRWIERFKAGRSEAVIELSAGAVAVSHETLMDDDLDLSAVVALLEKRGWLGVVPEQARGVRAGVIQFGDKRKTGFVINPAAAKTIGFYA